MNSNSLGVSAPVLRYPGWRMVCVGILCMMITFGIPISVLPLIYSEVIREFGWSMTDATLAFSYKQWTAAAISLLLVGPFIERLGLRTMMVTSCVVTGAAMASFLLIDSLWSYNLAVLSLGFGQAFTIIGVKILVSRWFTRRQGLAVGIALAGSSFGGSIFPLIYSGLATEYGWRMAMAVLSISIWVVVLPAYLFLARENPTAEDVASEAVPASAGGASAERLKEADNAVSFKEILRLPSFWCAAVGIAIISGVDGGLFQHTALYIQNDVGMSRSAAAATLSATFALGVVAKIAAGWVFDALSIRGVQLWWALIAVAVILAFSVQGAATLTFFAIVRGLAHGGHVADSPVIAKHAYGPKVLHRVLPLFTAALGIGGGLGPLLLSECYDHYGNYTVGFILLTILGVIAAGLLYFVKPTYRNRIAASSN